MAYVTHFNTSMQKNEPFLSVTDDQQKEQTRNLLKYMGLFGGVQGLNMLISLVRNKVTAVLLGTAGVGVLALFNSALNMLNSLTNLGVPFSTVRNLAAISQEHDLEKTCSYVRVVRCWSIVVSLLGLVACFVLSPWLSRWSFGTDTYTSDFRWLSVAVALTTLSACELAILKAVRQMRPIIRISWMSALGSLVIVVPIYAIYGKSGIVAVLILVAIWITVITYAASLKVFPLQRGVLTRTSLSKGGTLIYLGIAFILAGIFGSVSDYLLRAFLVYRGSIDVAALYNAANAILLTYMGSVFVAIDNDYFPKLSGLIQNKQACCSLVNGQMKVAYLLIAPLLAGVLLFLPLVMPVLYSAEFSIANVIIQYGASYLAFKSLTLPLSYMTLAYGDSKWYLILEFGYALCFVLVMSAGYIYDSLQGLGIGLSLMGLVDFIVLVFFTRFRYDLRIFRSTWMTAMKLLPLLLLSFFWSLQKPSFSYWIGGIIIFVVTVVLTVYLLSKETDFIATLRNRNNSRPKA